MKCKTLGVFLLLCCTFTFARAQEATSSVTIIPRAYQTNEGGGGSSVLRDAIRLQNVYSSRLFPSNKVLVIQELRYRPSAVWGDAFSARVADLQINLSTTRAPVDGLSATFANNVGSNDTVVFNGSVRLASDFCGPRSGPKDLDIIIRLNRPFRYNPAQGNLLIDYRNRSGSTATFIDSGVNNGASRAFALGADSTVAQSVDQGAEVVQLVYTEEEVDPEPPRQDGLIIPPFYADKEGVGGSSVLRDQLRLQNVYSSALFPSNKVLVIRELRYRPSAIHGSAFSATISNLQINLSTTHAEVDGLSTTFANNVGSNDTVVFNGSIHLASAFAGPAGGPKAFDIIIPLTTPFRYDPAKGNLLIDYRNRSGSRVTWIDSGVGHGASRRFALGADSTEAPSVVDQGAEVVQLIYTEGDSEPPPPPGGRFVIPPAYRSTEGVGGSSVLRDQIRLQNVYASGVFPSNKVLMIRELRYRPSAIHGSAFSATISNLQINLSTTRAAVGGLSATFANNVGSNDMVVFNGSIHVASAFTGPADGPKAFDIVIPLTRPFRYDPSQGNLLIDYRNRSGSAATWIDSGVNNGASRAFALGANSTVAQSVDEGAEVVQLVYAEADPEPPRPGTGLVIPPAYATTDSGGGSSVLHHEIRLQNVYSSRLFPSNKVLVIRELRYRPSAVWGNAFSTTISNLQINLSATDAEVDGLSATFADNVGANDTVVFNGAINISSAFAGPVDGPKAFDIVIPLTTPFRYDPAQGNLLIDYRNRSGSGAANIDAGSGNGASRVFALGADSTVAHSVDQGAEVVELIYTDAGDNDTREFDLSRDFAITSNPNGVWSYGRQETIGGAFTLLGLTQINTADNGVPILVRLMSPNTQPAILHNDTTNTAVTGGGGNYPPETTWFAPGVQGQPGNYVVARLTVPAGAGGNYRLATTARPAYADSVQLDTDFHVLRNNVEIFGVALAGAQTAGYTNTIALAGGDTVDFVVGRGADNSYIWSQLKVAATLSRTTGTTNGAAPTIITQPASQTVPEGSTVSFTVTASGSEPLNYQWHRGTTPIFGARRATLTLTNVQLSHAGNYSVVVSNSFGSAASQAATLTVTRTTNGAAPTIVRQPASQTVPEGSTVSFTVTASGSEPLNYQWHRGTTPIFGARRATLTLTNVQLSQAGNYSVVVSNSFGAVTSQAATLTVSSSGALVVPNVSQTVDDGGGSGLLNTQLRHQIVYDASQFPSNVIRITELRMRPSAQWGNAFTSTIPNLQINLSTTSVEADAMHAEFAQNIGSNNMVVFQGPLTVSSRFVGPPAGPKEFDIIIPLTTPFIYDPSRGNLLIDFRNSSGSSATFVDAGQRTDDGSSRAFALSVDATTAETRDPGAEVFQIVYGPATGVAPTITIHPQNRSVLAGESVTLNVSATGSAPLTYQWLKGGNPVPGATGTALTLTNVQVSDSGTYSVIVSNAYGVATSQPGTLTVSGSARLVVPNVSATVDDGGGSGLLNTQLRHQIVYDASQFPSNVIRITELRMRPSARWGNAFTSTIPNLQINLSTTSVEADAMHAEFAQNIGSNNTVVFQGPLTVSSRFVGPAAGPKEFDIIIPLTTPFIYDPRQGNLLIDFRNFSGSGATFVDAGQRTDDGSSRAFALSVDATTAETRDPGAEVFQIVYSAAGGVAPTKTTAQLTPMAGASPGEFAFTFSAVGGNYVVEASTDLINWTAVTNIVGVSGLVEVTDPRATTRQRFYRARLVP